MWASMPSIVRRTGGAAFAAGVFLAYCSVAWFEVAEMIMLISVGVLKESVPREGVSVPWV